MVALLKTCLREEQSVVIRFLGASEVKGQGFPQLTDKGETDDEYITSSQRHCMTAVTGSILPHQNQGTSVLLRRPENSCSHSSETVKAQTWNITCPESCELLATWNQVRTLWFLLPHNGITFVF